MMAGQGPYGPIEMGGMFTMIKIRKGITRFDDPGWYAHPKGTVAQPAGYEAAALGRFVCPNHPAMVAPVSGTCGSCGAALTRTA
jgi:hypothetical protein